MFYFVVIIKHGCLISVHTVSYNQKIIIMMQCSVVHCSISLSTSTQRSEVSCRAELVSVCLFVWGSFSSHFGFTERGMRLVSFRPQSQSRTVININIRANWVETEHAYFSLAAMAVSEYWHCIWTAKTWVHNTLNCAPHKASTVWPVYADT